jgi:hypothetical protein
LTFSTALIAKPTPPAAESVSVATKAEASTLPVFALVEVMLAAGPVVLAPLTDKDTKSGSAYATPVAIEFAMICP